MFCTYCGKPVQDDAVSCPECGKTLPVLATVANGGQTNGQPANDGLDAVSPKSRLALSLLAGLLGFVGAHRFYADRIFSGVIMLMLFLLGILFVLVLIGFIPLMAVMIWSTIDLVLAICGRFKDGDGRYITLWDGEQPLRPGAGQAPHAAQR